MPGGPGRSVAAALLRVPGRTSGDGRRRETDAPHGIGNPLEASGDQSWQRQACRNQGW